MKALTDKADGWGFVYLRTPSDMKWLDIGLRKGWRLPTASGRGWRWWGIRHVRWAWLMAGTVHLDHQLELITIGPGGRDGWVAYAIRKGWI